MASGEEINEAIYNITSELDCLPNQQEEEEARFSPPAEFCDEESNLELPVDGLYYVQEFEGK